MDFLTQLNLDRLYANKKPWHPSPWFLNSKKITQINKLIQEIHRRLAQPPSVAHQSLHSRFCSDYFWQSMATHSEYDIAYTMWQNTKTLIYANDSTLIWLVDYALPLLKEYFDCSIQDCQLLIKKVNAYPWLKYLPGLEKYLENIQQLDHFLQQSTINIKTLKKTWHHTAKIKIEQKTDILKFIAQKLDVPCDFVSEEVLPTHTLALFKQHYDDEIKLTLPHRIFDNAPPISSPIDRHSAWSQLTHRLRTLKESYRLTKPKATTAQTHSSWLDYFFQKSWPSFQQTKIYLLKKGVQYAGPPVLIWLLISGWLSLTNFGLGCSIWAIYPHLHTVSAFFIQQWQKLDTILQSLSDEILRDCLVERTEYVETLERSALWRKNTLTIGCHHINSFDPTLVETVYQSFEQVFEQQIQILSQSRPYFWQFWRHETTTLINVLVSELQQEKKRLQQDTKAYASDIATRLNNSLFNQKPYFLDKIVSFVTRFSPERITDLDQENRAIHYFLSCICHHSNSPVLFNRALINSSSFATHCIDIESIDNTRHQIFSHIKDTTKQQAVSALISLLKQENLISIEQLDNYLANLETAEYKSAHLKQAIQQHLFSTFNGNTPAIKKFFTPEHHKKLTDYLLLNKSIIQETKIYFQAFLDLPANQDWSNLPEFFLALSPEILKHKLALLKLNEHHDLILQVQNKIMSLAPHYSGAPSFINQWLNILWQENCPIELEEIVIESRLAWLLDNNAEGKKAEIEMMQAFVQEMSITFPKADNNHRLSRALVCQPHFYLPWQAHTQKMLDELEHNGLLLPSAKAGYSQKALRAWLQNK